MDLNEIEDKYNSIRGTFEDCKKRVEQIIVS